LNGTEIFTFKRELFSVDSKRAREIKFIPMYSKANLVVVSLAPKKMLSERAREREASLGGGRRGSG
jgi:hypothetical protein